MAITLSSDYLYVLAMLKTTPLVVTVGLSLTIPFAVVGDFIRSRPSSTKIIIGALLVLISFIAIGLDNRDEEEEPSSEENLPTSVEHDTEQPPRTSR
jgi:solute carrier family 35 protein F5